MQCAKKTQHRNTHLPVKKNQDSQKISQKANICDTEENFKKCLWNNHIAGVVEDGEVHVQCELVKRYVERMIVLNDIHARTLP